MGAEAFASRLRELREATGLTQQELADKAGMHREGVAQLERGRRQPTWETVLALGKALGVPCTSFDVVEGSAEGQPAPSTARKAGRPRKADTEDTVPKAKGKRKKM